MSTIESLLGSALVHFERLGVPEGEVDEGTFVVHVPTWGEDCIFEVHSLTKARAMGLAIALDVGCNAIVFRFLGPGEGFEEVTRFGGV
jgi:hypothetical protein